MDERLCVQTRDVRTATIPSPLGLVVLTGSDDGLAGVYFGPGAPAKAQGLRRDDGAFRRCAEQFAAYFAGSATTFDLPVAVTGTPFQTAVWALLREVPYGTTTTYGALAARLGKPGASRAVGLANGRNPIGVVVPCHRVVGSDGRLTGYAGGLDVKRWLLAHEQEHGSAAGAAPTPQRGPGPLQPR